MMMFPYRMKSEYDVLLRFAWLPIRTDMGQTLWFEHYYETRKLIRYANNGIGFISIRRFSKHEYLIKLMKGLI